MLGCWLPQRACNWNVFLTHHSPGKSRVLEEAVEYLQKRNGNSSFVRVTPHSKNTFLCLSDTVCSIFSVVMCSRYQHPNILDLLCCFSEEGRYCLVYPYLPNGSLYHRLHHQVDLSFINICWPTAVVHLALCPFLFVTSLPSQSKIVARYYFQKTGSELVVHKCIVVLLL